ncbi:DUF1294 domain-containing protein [Lederbergia galactosidilytica]|uniref:Membrane protein n=1 Tax=Lederbergia galactosidilytica TaxID=217031 RepID=A0A177ZJY2_9BACI|nr:DUF1294 domain-containing protein [Lederbergia galactosidilytica]KRG14485.1 membrane protein [Virgibacillus soli]MBP1915021.1 uncharacterized membrane protein YsdA (DUF1294 family) [Lederbergia galactosidilytica]OAK68252.1 membrane protein [Lederbergia galactosidilytica]
MISPIIVIYTAIINLWGIFVMRIDKRRAEKKEWRISEKSLWLIAVIGGAVGTTIGMWIFRHKTKHLAFKFGFPLLAVVDCFLFYLVLDRLS